MLNIKDIPWEISLPKAPIPTILKETGFPSHTMIPYIESLPNFLGIGRGVKNTLSFMEAQGQPGSG